MSDRPRAAHLGGVNDSAPVSRNSLDSLVDRLAAAARYYYDSEALSMTDAEYDAGLAAVEKTLAVHPDWSSPAAESLLGRVAAGVSAGGDVVHATRMLSMAKVAAGEEGLAEIDAFATRVEQVSTAGYPALIVEPKMDGLAVRAVYENGALVLAATRGDGTTGENITAQVRRGITGLPLTLPLGYSVEVRGEVYMTRDDFEKANEIRTDAGGKPFVNPRNGTAGALRKTGVVAMPMHFAAYDLIPADTIEAEDFPSFHQARMDMARKELGIETAVSLVPVGGSVRECIAQIESARPSLAFEIDGAVVKASDDRARDVLGNGSRTPNWAVAYKYAAEEASSVVEDIEVSVGRTGRIGLRARIAPTFVGGTTVQYAALHNPSWIAEQGIGIGSKVVLKRAGDVIPRITAALDDTGEVAAWTPPAVCPQCGEPWDTSSLLWRCLTPGCSVAGRLAYWASRDCLDIEGLGDTVAEALAETILVGGRQIKDVADLYDLTIEEWASLILGTTSTGATRTLGVANARKIMDSLLASKKQPFNRVITGLGIRMTGRSVGRWLTREFPTMDRLRDASVDEIAQIEKMGPIKAQAVVDGLSAMVPVIDRLAACGVNMGEEPPKVDAAALPLTGKTFVISGSIPGRSRTEAQEAVEAAGGKASSSVSKATTALITDETTTSKAKKAAELGVPIIDPANFEALLRGEAV